MASLPQPKFEPKAPDKSSSAACDANKKIQESDCSNVSTYSIIRTQTVYDNRVKYYMNVYTVLSIINLFLCCPTPQL